MSALPVVTPDPRPRVPGGAGRTRLRLVPRRQARMARLPFLTVLIALVGAGMVGLLLLNTSLQTQAFEASELRREAAAMSYAEGELEQLVTEAGSARELSRRASALGMRPNRDIAFIQLQTGQVTGEPRAADGLYLPSALTRSPEELAKEKAAEAVERAEERRDREQRILETHRQRITDARELDERRRAAEQAALASQQTGQQEQSAPQTAVPQPDQPATDPGNR